MTYDEEFWNSRYASDQYLYGTEANSFLAEHAHRLQGPVLSLSEGEGRNAVFLASLGLAVLGIDCSVVGLAKARALAHARGVSIDTEVADLADYRPPEDHFGAVISISAHLPSRIRSRVCVRCSPRSSTAKSSRVRGTPVWPPWFSSSAGGKPDPGRVFRLLAAGACTGGAGRRPSLAGATGGATMGACGDPPRRAAASTTAAASGKHAAHYGGTR